MNPADWPWYDVVTDDSLDQGDIIPECLVLHAVEQGAGDSPVAELRPVTALVITQTCDLAQDKVDSVMVCTVWSVARAILNHPALLKEATETAKRHALQVPSADTPSGVLEAEVGKIIDRSKALKKEMNAIMRGERPPFALLAAYEAEPPAPLSLVNFQQVYSLPRTVLAAMAAKASPRLRLRPPYREHVSMAFGRYFTRVGLPQDIPRYLT